PRLCVGMERPHQSSHRVSWDAVAPCPRKAVGMAHYVDIASRTLVLSRLGPRRAEAGAEVAGRPATLRSGFVPTRRQGTVARPLRPLAAPAVRLPARRPHRPAPDAH